MQVVRRGNAWSGLGQAEQPWIVLIRAVLMAKLHVPGILSVAAAPAVPGEELGAWCPFRDTLRVFAQTLAGLSVLTVGRCDVSPCWLSAFPAQLLWEVPT